MKVMRLLCRFGWHKWSVWSNQWMRCTSGHHHERYKVYSFTITKKCICCGKSIDRDMLLNVVADVNVLTLKAYPTWENDDEVVVEVAS